MLPLRLVGNFCSWQASVVRTVVSTLYPGQASQIVQSRRTKPQHCSSMPQSLRRPDPLHALTSTRLDSFQSERLNHCPRHPKSQWCLCCHSKCCQTSTKPPLSQASETKALKKEHLLRKKVLMQSRTRNCLEGGGAGPGILALRYPGRLAAVEAATSCGT